MIIADPVQDARDAGCLFNKTRDGVEGTLPAEGNKPRIVIHCDSVYRAALILLYAKEERDRVAEEAVK